ncbi:MAG: hypothetical protein EZS28_050425, partial [Streblomastix strix]
FPKVPQGCTDFRFSAILKEKLVLAVPGSAFGDSRCVRFAYCCDVDTIERAIPRIAEAVKIANEEKEKILPTEVKYIILDSQDEVYLSARGCFGDSYQYFLGSELGGIVSSQCISNDATQFPDYSGGTSTTVPPKPTKCDDGTADVKQYAKGLKFGYIEDASNDELKQILSRVGPIRGVINYQKDEDMLDRDEGILFGWDQDQWIIARQYIEPNIEYDEVTLYIEERIPFIHADGGTN